MRVWGVKFRVWGTGNSREGFGFGAWRETTGYEPFVQHGVGGWVLERGSLGIQPHAE